MTNMNRKEMEERRLDGMERAMAYTTLLLERLESAEPDENGMLAIEASQVLSVDELRVLTYGGNAHEDWEATEDIDLHYLFILQGLGTIIETLMVSGTHCSDCARHIVEEMGKVVANIRVGVEEQTAE